MLQPSGAANTASAPSGQAAPAPAPKATAQPAAAPAQPQANAARSLDEVCSTLFTAAQANALPVAFFANLIWQESRFHDHAVSPKGAMGIAQFMPQTAAKSGLSNPFDPTQALPASAKMLRELFVHFGNLGYVAAAYNAGTQRVMDWLERGRSLPRETRGYVMNITGSSVEAWRKTPPDESSLHFAQRLPCRGLPAFAELEHQAKQAELARKQDDAAKTKQAALEHKPDDAAKTNQAALEQKPDDAAKARQAALEQKPDDAAKARQAALEQKPDDAAKARQAALERKQADEAKVKQAALEHRRAEEARASERQKTASRSKKAAARVKTASREQRLKTASRQKPSRHREQVAKAPVAKRSEKRTRLAKNDRTYTTVHDTVRIEWPHGKHEAKEPVRHAGHERHRRA